MSYIFTLISHKQITIVWTYFFYHDKRF